MLAFKQKDVAQFTKEAVEPLLVTRYAEGQRNLVRC